MESEPSGQPSTDVLGTATTAYQQGKLTKAQYFAVINALDENTVQTTAKVETPGADAFASSAVARQRSDANGIAWNREYLAANAFLNQCRSSASVRPGGLGANAPRVIN